VRFAYPVYLDLTDRLVVIIGGGKVAARKAAGLIAGGAKTVRVVAPQVTADMPPSVEIIAEPYAARHLDDAALVFAATSDATVNAAIVRDARQRSIPVNRADAADDEAEGDFTVPALHRAGALAVAVSAAGAPALAARVRDEIERMLDPRWQKLADATRTLRPEIIARIPEISRRREALHDLATEDAARAAMESEMALRRWLASRYPELSSD
jgi:siroheme synthase-like protein